MKGKADHDVVSHCRQNSLPLLTTDWRLPDTQAANLSPDNPGVVVVRSDSPKTMTTKVVLAVINRFKHQLSTWHQLPPRNLIIELWPNGIQIRQVQGSAVVEVEYLDYASDGWMARFDEIMRETRAGH